MNFCISGRGQDNGRHSVSYPTFPSYSLSQCERLAVTPTQAAVLLPGNTTQAARPSTKIQEKQPHISSKNNCPALPSFKTHLP